MPVERMLREMSTTEFLQWQAIAHLDAEVRRAIADGAEPAMAERMVWEPEPADDGDRCDSADD